MLFSGVCSRLDPSQILMELLAYINFEQLRVFCLFVFSGYLMGRY